MLINAIYVKLKKFCASNKGLRPSFWS